MFRYSEVSRLCLTLTVCLNCVTVQMWNCRCTFCGFALHIAILSGSLKFSGMLRRRMLLMYLRYTSLLLSFSINLIFEQQCWWVTTQLSISYPVSEISCHIISYHIISCHIFSFCRSIQDYIIHMDIEIIFVEIKGWHQHKCVQQSHGYLVW